MSTFLRLRPSHVIAALAVAGLLAIAVGTARGQAGGIGARGGQPILVSPAPTLPTTPAPTTPLLPSTLNLPPGASSSLLKGLDQSGTAVRPGMGWLVSDMSHQGIKGPELADAIHQLKPYREHGRITFPQDTAGKAVPVTHGPQTQQPSGFFPRFEEHGQGRGNGNGSFLPNLGKGRGRGKK